MSIIHDALKKVQVNLSSQNDAPSPSQGRPASFSEQKTQIQKNPAPDDPQPEAPRPKVKMPLSSRFLWFSIFLALLPIAAIAASRIFTESRATAQIQKGTPRQTESPNILVIKPASPPPMPSVVRDTKIPLIPVPPRTEIILAGIVNIDGQNMALINNEYYAEGETVGGVKLLTITGSSVDVLLPDGTTRTLKLRHR